MCLPRLASLLLAVGSLAGSRLPGQEISRCPGDYRRQSLLPYDLLMASNRPSDTTEAPWSRCRLFRMPTGVGRDVLNWSDDDEEGALGPDDSFNQRQLQFALGVDNPYFDFRRPGDWGGVGFYKLHSQYTLLDSRTAGLALGFQAITPCGLDAGGIEHGPTVLSPNFTWFHELGGGTAIQGFVGKSVHARANWSDTPGRSIRYGLALQAPCPGCASDPSPRTHLFIEALGRNRLDGESDPHSPASLDLVPGIHWRWRDRSWITSGILMPLDDVSPSRLLWQLTCSWQY